MAVINVYPSWSQFAGQSLDPFLYLTLGLITLAFYGSSFDHPKQHRHLFNLFKTLDVRFEHIARFTAFMFLGVLTFSVNSPIKAVEVLHFIFTGLGIGFGYLLLLFYFKTNRTRLWSYVGVSFGVVGFLLGFLFNIYSIAWAEVIASLPLAIFLYLTYK
jgi:hypothetical protein